MLFGVQFQTYNGAILELIFNSLNHKGDSRLGAKYYKSIKSLQQVEICDNKLYQEKWTLYLVKVQYKWVEWIQTHWFIF